MITELLGKTLAHITQDRDKMFFTCSNGDVYRMYHNQDCCECVTIEDLCGDVNDLIGEPILMAEEITSDTNPEGIVKKDQDCFLWTFYKLATIKGYVTIRWYGSSNGWYSIAVTFQKVNK